MCHHLGDSLAATAAPPEQGPKPLCRVWLQFSYRSYLTPYTHHTHPDRHGFLAQPQLSHGRISYILILQIIQCWCKNEQNKSVSWMPLRKDPEQRKLLYSHSLKRVLGSSAPLASLSVPLAGLGQGPGAFCYCQVSSSWALALGFPHQELTQQLTLQLYPELPSMYGFLNIWSMSYRGYDIIYMFELTILTL